MYVAPVCLLFKPEVDFGRLCIYLFILKLLLIRYILYPIAVTFGNTDTYACNVIYSFMYTFVFSNRFILVRVVVDSELCQQWNIQDTASMS